MFQKCYEDMETASVVGHFLESRDGLYFHPCSNNYRSPYLRCFSKKSTPMVFLYPCVKIPLQ